MRSWHNILLIYMVHAFTSYVSYYRLFESPSSVRLGMVSLNFHAIIWVPLLVRFFNLSVIFQFLVLQMRHMFLVLDASRAMQDKDLKPDRITCTLKVQALYVRRSCGLFSFGYSHFAYWIPLCVISPTHWNMHNKRSYKYCVTNLLCNKRLGGHTDIVLRICCVIRD